MGEAQQGLRVFISYARHDAGAFAEDLLAGLEAAGFDAFLDQHDIVPGEPWEDRLGSLLQQCDTLVYVITPASVGSERCKWEIDHAEQLAKRVIPVVAIDVAETDTPAKLRRLNYIFFSQGHRFGESLKALSTALRTDVAWIREHTRLGDIAKRWQDQGRPEALLLRGTELKEAKAWALEVKPNAPEVTSAHREFINASDAAEQQRASAERKQIEEMRQAQEDRAKALKGRARATMIGGIVAGLLFLTSVAGGVGIFLKDRDLSDKKHQLAEAQQKLAEQQVELANARQANADNAASTQAALAAIAPSGPQVALGRAVPSAQSGAVRNALREVRIAQGWDIDVFWCAGAGAAQNQSVAERVGAILTAEQERQLAAPPNQSEPLPLGRIRVRTISEATNARPGYQVQGDLIRADSNENAPAAELARILSANQGPALQPTRSGLNTPYYLSIFICGGQ